MGVRPIQLWELAFPEPELHNVLKTIFPAGLPDMSKESLGRKLKMGVMKKLLCDTPLPEKIDAAAQPRAMYNNDFIAKYPIGLKKDNFLEDGTEEI